MVITQENTVCVCVCVSSSREEVLWSFQSSAHISNSSICTTQTATHVLRVINHVVTSVWLLTRNGTTICYMIFHCSNLAVGALGVQYGQHQLRHTSAQ